MIKNVDHEEERQKQKINRYESFSVNKRMKSTRRNKKSVNKRGSAEKLNACNI
jgi:hypothetical protein